ncbi:MAG: 3-hydroxyisobutyrate dehydrogenase [Pseudomonadota bacterium]
MGKIAFIGLGNMGLPMARNLIAAGYTVSGFDVVAEALTAAAGDGVRVCASVREVVGDAETVITMLPAGEHVRAVYQGADGIAENAPKGCLFIDSSTIDVDSARAVHDVATAAGQMMLDAPVSGGVAGAAAGTLTFMVGGEDAAFERGRALFEIMGRNVVHAGGAGAGQAAKVCNNMILGISMIALAESFTLGKKLGLAPEKLFEISSKSSGSCWAMLNHVPVAGLVETSAADRDFQPGFATAMMHKDLKLSQAAAASVGAATPLGAQATALYTMHVNAGHGELDYASIIKLVDEE